jgi:hypothetical protein
MLQGYYKSLKPTKDTSFNVSSDGRKPLPKEKDD